MVFEALGLTEEEQLEVYRAVVELVKMQGAVVAEAGVGLVQGRIEKARSLRRTPMMRLT